MGAAIEAVAIGAQGFRASTLRRPVVINGRAARLVVDPDASVRCLESLAERRELFGKGAVNFSKVQAGIVVAAQRPDWTVRLNPSAVQFSGRIFEAVEASQTFELSSDSPAGYIRKVRVRNSGTSAIRLRLVSLVDPTGAHFRDGPNWWGSLSLNAFNRESHVAMDEVAHPHPARVVGSYPSPLKYYMTNDKARGTDFLQNGDLPESTAGMSGQVLVLSLHEFELGPSETKEVTFASLYSGKKLEDVLAAFSQLQSKDRSVAKAVPLVSSQSPLVSDAFSWALASLRGASAETDRLDRLELLRGLTYVSPTAVSELLEVLGSTVAKDGSVSHASDWTKPGFLETSILLRDASRFVVLANDKKKSRRLYPLLKRMAGFLASKSEGGSLVLDPAIPQGWRRFVSSGYPSGEVPEVSLAAAAALSEFALLSQSLGKGEDAAKFKERSVLLAEGVRKRLVDERGFLGLCLDQSGKLHGDETIDTVLACYRNPSLASVSSSAVHRLLEKDFETGYGPRTVPTSNRMYFHPSYGRGQLGGYWTRAALAHTVLSYRTGLAGIGSLALEKVCKLVVDDSIKFGGVPGEFPCWVDFEGKQVGGEGNDRVSASRLVQAVVEGELGLELSAGGPSLDPPQLSTNKWVLAVELWMGEPVSVFVGRAGGKAWTFASCGRVKLSNGTRFAKSEEVEVSQRGLRGMSFHAPGQVVCIGNSTGSAARAKATFAPRSPGLSKQLSVPLEELDPANGSWKKVGSLRVSPSMSFDFALGPWDWKAYRVSTD